MWICSCRAINEGHVEEFLADKEGRVTASQIKRGCETQFANECHSCAPDFAEIAKKHNRKVAVREIGESMPEPVKKTTRQPV